MGYGYGHDRAKGVLLGAVMGGLAAFAAASFLTSKTGKRLRENLQETGSEFSEKVEGFISGIKENINEKTEAVSNKVNMAKDFVNDLDTKDFSCGIVVGSILGGLAGIGGTIVYQSTFHNHGDFDVFNNMRSQAMKWKTFIKDAVELVDGRPSCRNDSMNDLLDFAATGVRLWHKFRK